METNQYKNHPRQKESFTEDENFSYSRFQDPRDNCWYAYVESKDTSDDSNDPDWSEDGIFYIFSGPWKSKYKATDQIRIWHGDDDLIF